MGDMSREPSMEDILSSIRRVIARDEAPGLARGGTVTQNDVLELEDEEADGEPASPGETPAPVAETLADETPSDESELVSEQSAEAARSSLEALNAVLTPAVATAVAGPARSLEDVVVEALRPMLKQWLDANLPEMVEAMVAREISRITGRRL